MMTFVACVFSETDWTWCDIIFLETARDFHTSLRYPVVLKMVSEIDYSGKETFFFLSKLKVVFSVWKGIMTTEYNKSHNKSRSDSDHWSIGYEWRSCSKGKCRIATTRKFIWAIYKLTSAVTFKHLLNSFGQCLMSLIDSWVRQSKSAAPSTVTKCRRAVDFQQRKK